MMWIERESDPQSLACEASAFPLRYRPKQPRTRNAEPGGQFQCYGLGQFSGGGDSILKDGCSHRDGVEPPPMKTFYRASSDR